MPYSRNLSEISLSEYRETLKGQNLLPSRRMLQEDVDARFAALGRQGIADVGALQKRLSTPARLAALAKATGVGEDYLTLLKREIGSLDAKTVLLADFPGIDEALLDRLRREGIRTSKDYFESAHFGKDELSALSDLVRINGVGALAAKAFYEAGYRSVKDVAEGDAKPMLEAMSRVNEQRRYYKAKLAEKDMQFCIDFAKLLVERGG